jgi:D-3-phosphoglycerate dehydrogenase
MKGPCIGHVSPEAADGGPIALVEEGDLIEINIAERKLALVGLHGHKAAPEEIARALDDRRSRWSPPPPRHTSGILSLYSQVAGTASSGASLTPPPANVQTPAPAAHPVTAAEAAAPVVSTDGAPPAAHKDVKIVVLDYDFGEVDIERAIIEGAGFELAPAQCKSEDDVIAAAHDAYGVLCQYAPVGARAIESFEHCRVIARYGTGVDIVDVDAATKNGIQVTNAPNDWCADEVADHAVTLWLSAAREIVKYDAATRRGEWQWQTGKPIKRLRGSVLGLLSFGAIARAIADRARPFGVEVWAHDPFVDADEVRALGVRPVSFDELVEGSDTLLIQAPLTDSTRGLFDEKVLRRMKRSAILVNTARGPIVPDHALYRALKEGWIAGAALDDIEEEPAKHRDWQPDSPLFELDNVIVTPHAAYYSEESIRLVRTIAANEVVRVLTGQRPRSPVNVVEEVERDSA